MADNISTLYEKAQKKGLLTEGLTESAFREQTKDEEGLRKFYDVAVKRGFKVRDWDSFRNMYGAQPEATQSQAQGQYASGAPVAPTATTEPTEEKQSLWERAKQGLVNGTHGTAGVTNSGVQGYLHDELKTEKAEAERLNAANLPLAEGEVAPAAPTTSAEVFNQYSEASSRTNPTVRAAKDTRDAQVRAITDKYFEDYKQNGNYNDYLAAAQGRVDALFEQYMQSAAYKQTVAEIQGLALDENKANELLKTRASEEFSRLYKTYIDEINKQFSDSVNADFNRTYKSLIEKESQEAYNEYGRVVLDNDNGWMERENNRIMEETVNGSLQSIKDRLVNLRQSKIKSGDPSYSKTEEAAIQLYQEAAATMAKTKKGEYALGSATKDFMKELGNILPSAASLGVSELVNGKMQLDVLTKLADNNAFENPGSVLNDEEQMLYDAILAKAAANVARSKNTSIVANAATMTADMVPFMIDIYFGKKIFSGVTDLLKRKIATGVSKSISSKLGAFAATEFGNAGVNLLESAGIAAISPKTYAQAMQNYMSIDPQGLNIGDGKISASGVETMGGFEALSNAYVSQVKEYFTETGGLSSPILRTATKPFANKFMQTGFGKFIDRLGQTSVAKFAEDVAFNGIVGESLEEWEGTFYESLAAAIKAKDGEGLKAFKETWGDFLSFDNQMAMLLSFSVPSMLGFGASAAQAAIIDRSYTKAYDNLTTKMLESGQSSADVEAAINELRTAFYDEGPDAAKRKAQAFAIAFAKDETNADEIWALEAQMTAYLAADARKYALDQNNRNEEAKQTNETPEQTEQRVSQEIDEQTNETDGQIYGVIFDEQEGNIVSGQIAYKTDENGQIVVDTDNTAPYVIVRTADGKPHQVKAADIVLQGEPLNAEQVKQQAIAHEQAVSAVKQNFLPGTKVQMNDQFSQMEGYTDQPADVVSVDGEGNVTISTDEGNKTISADEAMAMLQPYVEQGEYETVMFERGGSQIPFALIDGTFYPFDDEGKVQMETPFTEERLAEDGITRVPVAAPAAPGAPAAPADTTYPKKADGKTPDWSQIDEQTLAGIALERLGNRDNAKMWLNGALSAAKEVLDAAKKVQKKAEDNARTVGEKTVKYDSDLDQFKANMESLDLEKRNAELTRVEAVLATRKAQADVDAITKAIEALATVKTKEELEAERLAAEQARKQAEIDAAAMEAQALNDVESIVAAARERKAAAAAEKERLRLEEEAKKVAAEMQRLYDKEKGSDSRVTKTVEEKDGNTIVTFNQFQEKAKEGYKVKRVTGGGIAVPASILMKNEKSEEFIDNLYSNGAFSVRISRIRTNGNVYYADIIVKDVNGSERYEGIELVPEEAQKLIDNTLDEGVVHDRAVSAIENDLRNHLMHVPHDKYFEGGEFPPISKRVPYDLLDVVSREEQVEIWKRVSDEIANFDMSAAKFKVGDKVKFRDEIHTIAAIHNDGKNIWYEFENPERSHFNDWRMEKTLTPVEGGLIYELKKDLIDYAKKYGIDIPESGFADFEESYAAKIADGVYITSTTEGRYGQYTYVAYQELGYDDQFAGDAAEDFTKETGIVCNNDELFYDFKSPLEAMQFVEYLAKRKNQAQAETVTKEKFRSDFKAWVDRQNLPSEIAAALKKARMSEYHGELELRLPVFTKSGDNWTLAPAPGNANTVPLKALDFYDEAWGKNGLQTVDKFILGMVGLDKIKDEKPTETPLREKVAKALEPKPIVDGVLTQLFKVPSAVKTKLGFAKVYTDKDYKYTRVQIAEADGNLYVRMSGTYKSNPVKEYFLELKDWENVSYPDLMSMLANNELDTRHLDDAIVEFYKGHGKPLSLQPTMRPIGKPDVPNLENGIETMENSVSAWRMFADSEESKQHTQENIDKAIQFENQILEADNIIQYFGWGNVNQDDLHAESTRTLNEIDSYIKEKPDAPAEHYSEEQLEDIKLTSFNSAYKESRGWEISKLNDEIRKETLKLSSELDSKEKAIIEGKIDGYKRNVSAIEARTFIERRWSEFSPLSSKERNSYLEELTSGMTNLQKAKYKSELNRQYNRSYSDKESGTVAEYMEHFAKLSMSSQGENTYSWVRTPEGTDKKEYYIADSKGGGVISYRVSKYGYDYFNFLVEHLKKKPAEQKPVGADNKVFTQSAYEDARERMRKRLNHLNAGLDPEALLDGMVVAGYHVEAGARKFVDYAKAMLADFGDAIRPYLKAFYNGMRDLPEAAELAKEMDDYATVSGIDVNAITLEEKPAEQSTEGGQSLTDKVVVGAPGFNIHANDKTEPKFKEGQIVYYPYSNGIVGFEVKDVNSNGTYNIGTEINYMGVNLMGIAEDKLMTPDEPEAMSEFFRNHFTEYFTKQNVKKDVLQQILAAIDKDAEELTARVRANNGATSAEMVEAIRINAQREVILNMLDGTPTDPKGGKKPQKPLQKEKSSEKTLSSQEKVVPLQENPASTPLRDGIAASIAKAESDFKAEVKELLLNALHTNDRPISSIVEIRAIAKKHGLEVKPDGKSDIYLQELVEDGIVQAARTRMEEMRKEGASNRMMYDEIANLYNLQPKISRRSNTRIAMQQYSTPLPMSFVADMFVYRKGMKHGFEPTAGNGMLMIGLPAEKMDVNELDDTRLANLRQGGFANVTKGDATVPFNRGRAYDFVVSNPPFGSAEGEQRGVYNISGLEQVIAVNALDQMKDDGRAAIIVGGNMEYAPNGSISKAKQKNFYGYLYDNYNVVGVVDMAGSLYEKQGTKYPTRMILINGRRSAEDIAKSRIYPPVESAAIGSANSFDELFSIVEKLNDDNRKTDGYEVLRSESTLPDGTNNSQAPRKTDGVRPEGKPRQRDGQSGGIRSGAGEKPSSEGAHSVETSQRGGEPAQNGGTATVPGRGGVGGNTGRVGGNNTVDGGREHNNGDSNRAGTRDGVGSGRNVVVEQKREKRELNTGKLSYVRHNSSFSLESVAPAAMVEAMDNFLKKIEKEYGNIDDFVTRELGYESVDDMHNALSAEQVDSVAMAIYQMKHDQSLIIGDQTGVGKGRQMAALIRWAHKNGKKPIFLTKTKELLSDIYRDLVDIGSGDLRPFVFNTGEKITDQVGNVVYRSLSAEEQKVIMQGDQLPDDYDYAILTYSQVNTGDELSREGDKENKNKKGKKSSTKPRPDYKASFLRKIAKDNYLFMDESHEAAGKGKGSAFMRSLLGDTAGVTYASATFAKRANTMPLYALRTIMSKANVETEQLIEIIERGGVTLQEIMSRFLTQAGQMVRRERDMSDVVTDWETIDDPEIVKKSRDQYDRTIKAFNAIIGFQKAYVDPYLNGVREDVAALLEDVVKKKGTDKMGIDNQPFASKTYNYTKQLMLALKAQAVVDRTIKEIERGLHPVIALENTMESAVKEYGVGSVVDDPTFASCLLKGLDKALEYTKKDSQGNETHHSIPVSELGAEGEAAYYALRDFIIESTKDIFVSPIDAIKEGLAERGYSCGELTGRSTELIKNGNGDYVVRTRTDKDKKKLMREFNSGKLDVLILNKSASTGISLHSSSKFDDQRQRAMIIAQPLSDINDYMQMIGRIDRTGQVWRGYYINLGLPIPAENRFLMMLSTKLKSLNANTTTSQDNEGSNVEAPDFLNKYGDFVICEYLSEHPEIYDKLDNPFKIDFSKETVSDHTPTEGDALKVTGRVALLTTEEQERFYEDVIQRYLDYVSYKNDMGENDLKITTMPLRAKTLEKKVSSEGVDPTGDNPFAQNAYLETVEVDVLKKPMKAAEIQKAMDGIAYGVNNYGDLRARIENETQAKRDAEDVRFAEATRKAEDEIESMKQRVNARLKMTEEQKAEEIERKEAEIRKRLEEVHSARLAKLNGTEAELLNHISKFVPGRSYLMPSDLTREDFKSASNAVFIGYKANDDGITPSTTIAVFAVLDGRKKVEIKMSNGQVVNMVSNYTSQNYDAAQEVDLSNWDSQIPTESRKKAYIMTGNIIQAINDTMDENGNYTGQLISYTDEEGGVHEGVLMPETWTAKDLRSHGVPINARLQDLIKKGKDLISNDKSVKVSAIPDWKGGFTYKLYVPKTKKSGGMYFEDETILGAVEDRYFYQRGEKMVADIHTDEDARTVVNRLAQLGVRIIPEETENEEGAALSAGDNQGVEMYENGLTDAQQLATDAVKTMLEDAGIKVNIVSNEEADSMADEGGASYSVVTDNALREKLNKEFNGEFVDIKDVLKRLENGEELPLGYTKMYRAVRVINGKPYSPKMTILQGVGNEIALGEIEQSDEKPEIAYPVKLKSGKTVWKVDLDGGDPTGSGLKKRTTNEVDYNPYIHLSSSAMNDQFVAAYAMPEMGVIEVKVPLSEFTSGYKADKAAASVGILPWHKGTVQTKLKPQYQRSVMLSRYDMPIRIVDVNEVADMVAKQLIGSNVEMPFNLVTPQLAEELVKRGAKVSDKPSGNVGAEQVADWARRRANFSIEGRKVFGFTKDGEITLAERGINPNTPVHEYSHLWCEAVRKNNVQLWESVKRVFAPFIDEVRNEPQYANIRENEDALVEEAVARFSGKQGAQRLTEWAQEHINKEGGVRGAARTQSFIAKVREALNKLWSWIGKNLFHLESFSSAEEVADRILYDLANKTSLKTGNVGEGNADMSGFENTTRKQATEPASPSRSYDPNKSFRENLEILSEGMRKVMSGEALPGSISLRDLAFNAIVSAAQNHADQHAMHLKAAKAVDKNLQGVKRAMRMQQIEDDDAANNAIRIAQVFLRNNWITPADRQELNNVLSSIGEMTDTRKMRLELDRMLESLVHAHRNHVQDYFNKVRRTVAERIGLAGVTEQGAIDLHTKYQLDAYNEAVSGNLTVADIESLVLKELDYANHAEDGATKEKHVDRAKGYLSAKQYAETVGDLLRQEVLLRIELKDAKEKDYSGEEHPILAKREAIRAAREAIIDNMFEQLEAYENAIADAAGIIINGKMAAAEFRQKQIDHMNMIRHFANSDLLGISSAPHYKETALQEFMNSKALSGGVFAPLQTMNSMFKALAPKSADGKGYLWNHFMRGFVDASESEFRRTKEMFTELDDKAAEITGGKCKTFADFADKMNRGKKILCSFYNGTEEGKPKMEEHELTQGQIAYLYAVNKMADGKMKITAMGITDEDLQRMFEELDPAIKQMYDWIQSDLLPRARTRYNEVYEGLFGAPMAAIENYFPIRVNTNTVHTSQDINDEEGIGNLSGTTTGSLLKRVRNSRPLDILHDDAFAIMIDHVQEMEHWAAFSNLCRDMNILINYDGFKNKLGHMSTMYGAGADLFKNLKDCMKISVGTYKPHGGKASALITSAAKGVSSAKITLRMWTAAKQLLSHPAFYTEAMEGDGTFIPYYLKALGTPYHTFKWAQENLPLFQKRLESRAAGDTRLLNDKGEWDKFNSRLVEIAARVGMAPNAFVDALTISQGAYAIYMSKKGMYIERMGLKPRYDELYEKFIAEGMSKKDAAEKADRIAYEPANKRALQDASIAYNETQQSSELGFVSSVQKDKDFYSVAVSLFQNANMAYMRRMYEHSQKSIQQMANRKAMIEYMTKQNVRLYNVDEDVAEKMAKTDYNKDLAKNMFGVVLYGYIMQALWRLGGNSFYLLFGGLGDDDDKWWNEEKTRIVKDALTGGAFSGFARGTVAGKGIEAWMDGYGWKNVIYNTLPIQEDVKNFENSADLMADLIDVVISCVTGISPKTVYDYIAPAIDAYGGDMKKVHEAWLLIARIMSVPSDQQRNLYIDEFGATAEEINNAVLYNPERYEELLERYAEYETMRSAPFIGRYGTDEQIEKIKKSKRSKLEKKVNERKKIENDGDYYDDFYLE